MSVCEWSLVREGSLLEWQSLVISAHTELQEWSQGIIWKLLMNS